MKLSIMCVVNDKAGLIRILYRREEYLQRGRQ